MVDLSLMGLKGHVQLRNQPKRIDSALFKRLLRPSLGCVGMSTG